MQRQRRYGHSAKINHTVVKHARDFRANYTWSELWERSMTSNCSRDSRSPEVVVVVTLVVVVVDNVYRTNNVGRGKKLYGRMVVDTKLPQSALHFTETKTLIAIAIAI